jgi:hypothetical protein
MMTRNEARLLKPDERPVHAGATSPSRPEFYLRHRSSYLASIAVVASQSSSGGACKNRRQRSIMTSDG